jgi:hypothetical protein
MGQLDEAIRAHLELKRKHGASEEELKAEEQEALGPVRREPSHPEPIEADDLAEPDVEDQDLYDEPLATTPEAYEEPLDDQAPEVFHEPVDPLVEPGFDRHVAEPLEAADPLDPEPAAPYAGDTPPRGFEAVEEQALEDVPEGEDVLEETPDFLQETPEHDRLWFEQKPPRDFDFDE